MIKNNEYIFHNPNSENETINFLIKLIATAAVDKLLGNDLKTLNCLDKNPNYIDSTLQNSHVII